MDPTAPGARSRSSRRSSARVRSRAATSAAPDPRVTGPLDRETALAFLAIGDRLLESGEPAPAAGYYQRVIGFDDPAVTAAATLGLGNALYRLDRDERRARGLARRRSSSARPRARTRRWRQIAAALVRDGDLAGAAAAYREADKRAPAEDKAEIASRLGWLAKETGDQRGASRYFARSRGGTGLPIPLTYLIIGLTVIVSLTASTPDGAGPAPGALARQGGGRRRGVVAARDGGPRPRARQHRSTSC